MGDILLLDFAGLSVPPRNPFEMVDAFKADESMAWELTAVAVKHLGAKGCYRAPSGGGLYTFLAITDIRKMLQ